MRRTRRIGLVGFGSIAEYGHLPAWQCLPGVKIAAVADLSHDRLDRARRLLPEAALYSSPEDLIRQAEIDGIDICTPPSTHANLILAACARGVADVVCEKPLVLSEEEYIRVAGARTASGSRVISINNWVHSDLNRHVSALLLQGAVGAIHGIELRTGRPDCALGHSAWLPRWRTNRAYSGGGIILDHGWHQLYLLMGWMQEPMESISARTRTVDSRHYPVEDEASIDVLFLSGRGRIELSWTASNRTNGGVIRGEDGTIRVLDDRVVIRNTRGQKEFRFSGRLTESSYHPGWFEAVFRDNVLSESRAEADRNFAEAGALVSVIRAAYRSAKDSGVPCRPALLGGEEAGSHTM